PPFFRKRIAPPVGRHRWGDSASGEEGKAQPVEATSAARKYFGAYAHPRAREAWASRCGAPMGRVPVIVKWNMPSSDAGNAKAPSSGAATIRKCAAAVNRRN